MNFDERQLEALRGIVYDWISEGFTTPPYSDEQYDIFEKLEIDADFFLPHSYDIRRPDSVLDSGRGK